LREKVQAARPDKKFDVDLTYITSRVCWFLSVDETSLPSDIAAAGQRTFRSITVNNQELEFSGGFTDLHTLSYQDILDGGGFHAAKARPSIETVYTIRNAEPAGLTGEYHPLLNVEKKVIRI
jgi:UDP-N-acetyl-2-amino-2-deoxyglucuronate dehydrogenase